MTTLRRLGATDLHMAADARLALAEHLRELADRQFHRAQQREDSQPGRVGKGTEDVEGDRHCAYRYKDIFISGQRAAAMNVKTAVVPPPAMPDLVRRSSFGFPPESQDCVRGTQSRSNASFRGRNACTPRGNMDAGTSPA